MSEQTFRSHDDQRKRICLQKERLPSQKMEVLRRGRTVRDSYVCLCGKLQEALEAPARMVGTLAFVSVGEKKHEGRSLSPFRPRRGHELVDHYLCIVYEIAVLRFPDNQSPRLLDIVAVFKTDGGVFCERTVVRFERSLCRADRLERRKNSAVLDVVICQMPVAECSSLSVLSREPYRNPIFKD